MSGRLRFLALLLFVVVLALLSSWLLKSVEKQFRQPGKPASYSPDYFLDNFTATVMSADGSPEYIVDASRLDHYKVDESLYLRDVTLEVHRDPEHAWKLHADRGEVYQKGEKVYLMEHVMLEHITPGTQDKAVMLTNTLQIDTRTNIAYTYAPVTITQAKNIIEADGMRVDLAAGTMELLANVRGHYELP